MKPSIILFLIIMLVPLNVGLCFISADKPIFYFGRYTEDDIVVQKEKLPSNLNARIDKYRKRYLSFKSTLQSKTPSKNENDPFLKMIAEGDLKTRQIIEKTIYSLIDAENIRSAAAKFANKITFGYEWEGFSDGPIAEAKNADEILSSEPATPARPYILLYMNYRDTYALRALEYELKYYNIKEGSPEFKKNRRQYEEIKTKMTSNFDELNTSSDPLIVFISKTLEAKSKNKNDNPNR